MRIPSRLIAGAAVATSLTVAAAPAQADPRRT